MNGFPDSPQFSIPEFAYFRDIERLLYTMCVLVKLSPEKMILSSSLLSLNKESIQLRIGAKKYGWVKSFYLYQNYCVAIKMC